MLNAILPDNPNSRTFVCPAEVIETGKDQLYRVRAEFPSPANSPEVASWALLAIEVMDDLAAGDKVLITGESMDACYIIGVIKRQCRAGKHMAPERIKTRSGAYAQALYEGDQDSIQIRDEHDHLIFEYDPGQKRVILSISEGDLCLNAPNGEIQLFSSKGIKCHSLGDMQIESQTEINLKVPSVSATPVSTLQLNSQHASLSAQACNIKAKQANLLAQHTKIEGDSLFATLSRSKLVVERLETVAKRVFQRAMNIFCRVENLQQTQVGKVRTRVTEDYYLKARDTDIQAQKDFKINADKIHLG